ncbi:MULTISPECIES: hypothetical protein [Bacteria]
MDVGFMRPLLVWRGYWIDGENVMSGFKGTHGPWELMKDDNELKVIQAGSLEKGFGWKSYCNVCENVSGDANAKLIAAAPELLDALHEFSRLYGRLWDTTKPEGGFLSPKSVKEYDRIHVMAEQAIKKALGN